MTGPTIRKESAVERIRRLKDPEDLLYGVVRAGEDDTYWYYMVIHGRVYKGNEYLNERYVQLVKPDADAEREDSYKTNGINRRAEGVMPLAASLSKAYEAVEGLEKRFAEGQDPAETGILYIESEGDEYNYETDMSLVD